MYSAFRSEDTEALGINKIPELVDLLHRCKTAIVKLDSKCYIVDNERAKTDDRRVMASFKHSGKKLLVNICKYRSGRSNVLLY